MTKGEAEALRVKWKQYIDPPGCEHLIQEGEENEDGYSTSYYVCNLCGESAAQRGLAAYHLQKFPHHQRQRFPLVHKLVLSEEAVYQRDQTWEADQIIMSHQ